MPIMLYTIIETMDLLTPIQRGQGGYLCPFGEHVIRPIAGNRLFLILFGLAFITLPSLPGDVDAVELRGNLFGELYSFKEQDSTLLRPYAGLRSDLLLVHSGRRTLDLTSSLRWTNNLRSSRSTVGTTNIYDLYFHLGGIPAHSDLYLGRQFVYNAAGSAVMDGARLRYQVTSAVNIEGLVGTSVNALNPTSIRSLSSYGVFGGRASWSDKSGTRVNLSWLDRLDGGHSAWNRAALDWDDRSTLWQSYIRVAYDLVNSRISELLSRVSYSPAQWYLSAEISRRAPSVSGTSLFIIIDSRQYRQVRLEARRTLWSDLALYAQLHGTLYSGETIWRVVVGVRGIRYNIGWTHQTGRDGDNNSVTGSLNFPLATYLEGYAGFNAGRYRVQTEQEGRSDAYTSQLGFTWHGLSGYSATLEGQYQRNAVEKSAGQFYLRLSKDFTLGTKSAGVGRR